MISLKVDIPSNFFSEEERCDYVVSSKMKKVWAVELDLLSEVLRVCKKNDIKIFAGYGALLGAVRHAGFIPWDDDIDLMMFREDYEKLCEIAGEEFKWPYYFQTEYNDQGTLRGHAQLRNSETTAILDSEMGIAQFNQGIFIDIFPLDNVIEDKELFEKQFKRAKKYKRKANRYASLSSRYKLPKKRNLKSTIKQILYPVASKIIRKFDLEVKNYSKFEEECKRYNNINTKLVSTLSFQFNNERHFKLREDFDEIILLPFEFLKIPVGEGYENTLRRQYGDYHKFVKGATIHGDILFDPCKGYLDYLTNNGDYALNK